MVAAKKPPLKRTSPFGTSNSAAAGTPPRSSIKSTTFGVTEFDNNRAGYKGRKPVPKAAAKKKPEPQRTPAGKVVPAPRTQGKNKVQQAPVMGNGLRKGAVGWKQPPAGQSAESGFYKTVGKTKVWVTNKENAAAVAGAKLKAQNAAAAKAAKPKKPVTNYPNSSTSRNQGTGAAKKTTTKKVTPPKKTTPTSTSGTTWNNATGSAMNGVKHVVKPGDSVWKIAKSYGGSNAQVNQRMHNIIAAHPDIQSNPNLIKPGQTIQW